MPGGPGFTPSAAHIAQFERDGFAREDIRFRRIGELLYSEQMHELPIDLGDPPFTADSLERSLTSFHEEHLRTYGHNEPGDAVSFINLKVLGEKPRVTTVEPQIAEPVSDNAEPEVRDVYFASVGWVSTDVVARPSLSPGTTVEGPMLLTQVDTTVVLPPGSSAEVLASGDLMVDVDT